MANVTTKDLSPGGVYTPKTASQATSPTDENSDETPFLNRTSVLKICQIVCSLLASVCTFVAIQVNAGGFINFVCLSALLIAVLYLVIHSMPKLRNLFGLHTFLFEMIKYCIWSVLYLTAAIVAMAFANQNSAMVGTAIFATGGTIAFSIDAYFQLREWREKEPEESNRANRPIELSAPQPRVNLHLF